MNVQLQAAYTSNALTTPAMQSAFLAQSGWNLCFLSNDTGVPQERCWFEQRQPFASVKDYVNVTLRLPDAAWALALDAPFGAVTALVTLLPATGPARVLASVERCKAREAKPLRPVAPAAVGGSLPSE